MSEQGPPPIPPIPPIPPTPPPAATDPGNRTIMLILAYLGPLALVPLLTEKDDREVQWHAKHGLVQLAAFLIAFVGLSILSSIGILCVFAIFIPFIGLAWMIVTIVSIVKALNGQRFIIPGISQFADRF
jgi:uncharacterized membrane protein